MIELSAELQRLLKKRVICFFATIMPDGSPQMTQTWIDTDGTYILINTVEGHQKHRNVMRDPRVMISVVDPGPLGACNQYSWSRCRNHKRRSRRSL